MSNVSKVKVQGTVYDIEDSSLRSTVASNTARIIDLENAEIEVDTTLTQEGMAADAAAVGDEISNLRGAIQRIGGGLSEEVKQALMDFANAVAFKSNVPTGQTYIDALEDALYPPTNLSYITAVYTQSGTVYDTDSLDDLKTNLVVTAYYDDLSDETVTSYVLSGNLTVGTSIITVAYGGKTTTFNVNVTENRYLPTDYTWLYDARGGELLSAQSYVTKTESGTTSETINENDELVLHCNSNGTASGTTNVLLTFALTDTTTTNAKLSARAKLVDLALTIAGQALIGQRLQLSDGSAGATVYFEKSSSNATKITVGYNEGETINRIETEFNIDEYHVFELIYQNARQALYIDGTEVFNTATLSTAYTTNNNIRLHARGNNRTPNGVTTNFDWIAYYEQ